MADPLVPNLHEVKNILSSVNWSFSTSSSVGRSGIALFDVRKYHWYPATFIPEIPFTLIDILTKPEAKVFDPFAGIGTTIFQSLLLGRIPYGTEISTVAVKLMNSYWTLLKPDVDLGKVRESLVNIVREYKPNNNYAGCASNSFLDFEPLQPWYNKKTFHELQFLFSLKSTFNDDGIYAAYYVALSATLKAVCAQDNGFGCISDNVLPSEEQLLKGKKALQRFQNNLLILIRDFEKLKLKLPSSTKEFLGKSRCDDHIFHQDIRQFEKLEDEEIDLVVTSPPYPNMTDYSFSQRLSYYFLGQRPEIDIEHEIGARRKRLRKNNLELYEASMKEAIDIIYRKLKYRGYACFVLPLFSSDSTNNTDRQMVIEKCLAYFSEKNLLLESEFMRILPERRRQHNKVWRTLTKERIMLYRKK